MAVLNPWNTLDFVEMWGQICDKCVCGQESCPLWELDIDCDTITKINEDMILAVDEWWEDNCGKS